MSDQRPSNSGELFCTMLIFMLLVCYLFLSGTPSLREVILYRLSNGAVALPKP